MKMSPLPTAPCEVRNVSGAGVVGVPAEATEVEPSAAAAVATARTPVMSTGVLRLRARRIKPVWASIGCFLPIPRFGERSARGDRALARAMLKGNPDKVHRYYRLSQFEREGRLS